LVTNIIKDNFKERLIGEEKEWKGSIPTFNDHSQTTFDDIRMVLEKASAKLDEFVREF